MEKVTKLSESTTNSKHSNSHCCLLLSFWGQNIQICECNNKTFIYEQDTFELFSLWKIMNKNLKNMQEIYICINKYSYFSIL